MNDARVTFIAKLTAKSGSEGQLGEAITGLVAPTRAEPGCLHYILHVSHESPREFVIYESWKCEADFQKHTTMPHFQALMARMPELVDGPPTRTMLRDLTA